jgi:metal transporter CNNM
VVLVSESPGEDSGAIGVLTLEDVIEELIGEYVSHPPFPETTSRILLWKMDNKDEQLTPYREIIDESDVYIDVSKSIKRTSTLPVGIGPKEAKIVGKDTAQSMSADTTISEEPLNGSLRRRSTALSSKAGQKPKHLGPSNLASRPTQTRYR